MSNPTFPDPARLAAELVAEIRALPEPTTDPVRAVRRRYTRRLATAPAEYVLDLAWALLAADGPRWVAYELIAGHPAAFSRLGEAEVEALGRGIDSWWTVDAYASTIAGPAWREGLVSDGLIHRWARSEDLWQRRAALVCTVSLNVRTRGGQGDVPRTLAVCQMLVDDREDMVVKALSWALRALIGHDAEAVRGFLAEYGQRVPARARREVEHKLRTGLKNPRRKTG